MKNKSHTHLIISGIIFTIVLFLWPLFMAIAQPAGEPLQHFDWIQKHLSLYKIQFLFAFLIAPSILYMMISQLEVFRPENRAIYLLGFIFLAGYLVLISIAYASQIVVIPNMIEAGQLSQARWWYMGSHDSFIYFINQLGYFFWGTGSIILFYRLIKEKGLIRYISLIYCISALLSIIALAGLLIGNKFLNSMTLYSGLALIPVGILSIILGMRNRK